MTAPHHDFIDPETERHWRVRFVRKGARYRHNHCLTHEEDEPLVEFYDRKFAGDIFPDEGQFVSRYYVSTLLKRRIGMLNLDGGIEAWRISADGMREDVMRHVAVWQARAIIHT